MNNTGGKKNDAVLKNSTIIYANDKISFDIPEAWIKWFNENENHPNIHLSAQQLSAVKNAEGEWDKEFATYANYLLPFENCFAHAGAEGWGSSGLSYADLQVRAYVFEKKGFNIQSDSLTKKLNELPGLISTIKPVHAVEQSGEWERLLISYNCVYEDYGASASIDIRIKYFNNSALVFVFMYTNHTNHSNEINNILKSAVIKTNE